MKSKPPGAAQLKRIDRLLLKIRREVEAMDARPEAPGGAPGPTILHGDDPTLARRGKLLTAARELMRLRTEVLESMASRRGGPRPKFTEKEYLAVRANNRSKKAAMAKDLRVSEEWLRRWERVNGY
jgi:hypothetical protein